MSTGSRQEVLPCVGWVMFNCSNCDSSKKLVNTKKPTARCSWAVEKKDEDSSDQVNPWINLFKKIFWAVSQLGQKWMIGQITTAQINLNCSTCVVYMCGSKKHVWYTSAAAKICAAVKSCAVYMCGSKKHVRQ